MYAWNDQDLLPPTISTTTIRVGYLFALLIAHLPLLAEATQYRYPIAEVQQRGKVGLEQL